MAKVNLYITDTNYNTFEVLCELLKGKTGGLNNGNLIFCEEKISLMTERMIAQSFGGSFNTDVYSFGNYLRKRKSLNKVLSKEGSAMAIRRLLSSITLKCLPQKDGNLAPNLYDLIVLLKSSKVSPLDLQGCVEKTSGVLKNKLLDLALIYSEYDKFLQENDIEDQSSILGYLPQIISTDNDIKNTDVFLLGYSSFTEQGREIVKTLINSAKSVTAILVGGDNKFLYVNETVDCFRNLCSELKEELTIKTISTELNLEAKLIKNRLFNPSKEKDRLITDKICKITAKTPSDEIDVLASTIKNEVVSNNLRYRDFTVVIPQNGGYGEKIKRAFASFDIPYFLDEKKKPLNNPLIKLIIAYFDCHRKNLEMEALCSFYKNPLFCEDKALSDDFYNYVKAYGVNFNRIKKEFSLGDDESVSRFEEFRLNIVKHFEGFNVYKLLEDLSVKEKLDEFSNRLRNLGENVEAEINDQIYDYVLKLLSDMDVLLGDVKVSVIERKRIFLSGVNALELSIIPQYKDAVFVGGFKEASLAKAKNLYVLGLTDALPETKDDVALLNDKDIKVLSGARVKIEPNIKIVNDREKENAGLGICSFSDKLYLSYPTLNEDGKKTFKSRILESINDLFIIKPYYFKGRYLTYKEGLKSFAIDCKRYSEGKIVDFLDASDFYHVVKEDQTVKGLLDRAQKKVDSKLNKTASDLTDYVHSPTAIEDFYACPYRAFISKALSVKEGEDGKLTGASTGNILHDVMDGYLRRYDEVIDEQSFNKVIEEEILKVLQKEEYKKYKEVETSADLDRVLRETKTYAKKTDKHFKDTSFRPHKLEAEVNLSLLSGKVNLHGKIDRIDKADGYYRIIDYKTGKYDVSTEALFSGNKLQLYLYSKMAEINGVDGKLAGLFYAPVNDLYEDKLKKTEFMLDGKVLDEKGIMELHGEKDEKVAEYIKISSRTKKGVALTAEALSAHVKYAVKMCESAVNSMSNGFIASSPIKGACSYCKFSGVCDKENFPTREVAKVNIETIVDAVKEDLQ